MLTRYKAKALTGKNKAQNFDLKPKAKGVMSLAGAAEYILG